MDNLSLVRKAAAENKLAHFLLFHGSGTEERHKAALDLACLLNCEEVNSPCRECSSCKKISSGNHPDVHILKPLKTSVGIEQVMQMQEKIYRKHFEGKFRICLIEEADKLTLPAANALLKISEDPPDNTLIILSTSNGEGIISTLQSRAQSVYFSFPTRQEWKYGSESYDLSGGDPDLACKINDLGIEKVKQSLSSYLEAVNAADFLKVYSLFPLEKDETLILIQALAVNIREQVIRKEVSPQLLQEIGRTAEALRKQANPRLVLEVLALKHIEMGGSKIG
ncbi:MAG: DNA polymerase [Gracilibacter sp. BRH_c7a]|nr:MAG: DNA polymerase [Gracilibacter sp. BRH_c7a]